MDAGSAGSWNTLTWQAPLSTFAVAASLLLAGALPLGCGGKSAGKGPGGGSAGSSPTEPSGCRYAGTQYDDGESFPAMDGCNSCSCDDGNVGCTEIGCDPGPGPARPPISCDQVVAFYGSLVEESRLCDPSAPAPCSMRVKADLICGCETFVDPSKWNNDLAAAYGTHYGVLSCGDGIVCGPCPTLPVRGFCNADGQCTDASDIGGAPACKVGGVIYVDGSSNIPDPSSCNLCTCNAGKLVCTEKNCPKPCAPDSKFASSCAQCGPIGGCEIVEYGCLPACTDSCADGRCIDGVCVNGLCR
jgi:hypothetical protein